MRVYSILSITYIGQRAQIYFSFQVTKAHLNVECINASVKSGEEDHEIRWLLSEILLGYAYCVEIEVEPRTDI